MKTRFFRNDLERREYITNLDNWDLFDWKENIPIKQYSLEIDGAEFVMFCPLRTVERKRPKKMLVTAYSQPFADPVPIYKAGMFYKGNYSQKSLRYEYTIDQIVEFMKGQEKEHEQERYSGNG